VTARRCAAVVVAALTVSAVSGCTTVDHTSTAASALPAPTGSTAATYEVQLRGVLDVANAQAGECGTTAPPTPEPRRPATLCSADLVLVYTLAPAAVSGSEVTGVEAVFSSARPVVRITVTPQGGAGLVRVTSEAMNASPPRNQLALVSRGRVQTAVPVSDTIDGQVLEISGFDSIDAARAAAALLQPSAPTPSPTAASPSSASS
jgi:preprotein translocase subunit SecD